MIGNLSFDGVISAMDDETVRRAADWVRIFKQNRHLMVQDFYSLLPQARSPSAWDAASYVSYDKDEALTYVFAGSEGGQLDLRFKGLDADADYELTRYRHNTEPTVINGGQLMDKGLPIEHASDEGSLWKLVKAGL